jgi:hypothetical protein
MKAILATLKPPAPPTTLLSTPLATFKAATASFPLTLASVFYGVAGLSSPLPMPSLLASMRALAKQTYDQEAPNFLFQWASNLPIAGVINNNQPPLLVIEGANNTSDNNNDTEEEEEEEEEEEHEKEDNIYVNTEDNDKNEGAQGAPDEAPDKHNEVQGAPNEVPDKDKGAQGTPNKDKGAPNNNKEPPKCYNLQGNRIDYGYQFAHQFTQLDSIIPQGPQSNTATNLQNDILAVGLVFNQMGAKVGVKKYGNKAIQAIVDLCKQLDDKKVFKPRNIESLTESITLIKKKRCSRIKGHTVTDGQGQRNYILRDDATSPTISIKALMISIAIDAKEKR